MYCLNKEYLLSGKFFKFLMYCLNDNMIFTSNMFFKIQDMIFAFRTFFKFLMYCLNDMIFTSNMFFKIQDMIFAFRIFFQYVFQNFDALFESRYDICFQYVFLIWWYCLNENMSCGFSMLFKFWCIVWMKIYLLSVRFSKFWCIIWMKIFFLILMYCLNEDIIFAFSTFFKILMYYFNEDMKS